MTNPQVVDFQPFLSQSLNPLIRKYLAPEEFAKFEIDEGDLEWNDYDLCFPIADLYGNRIKANALFESISIYNE